MFDLPSRVSWTIQYEPQIIFDWGLVAGAFELIIVGLWFSRDFWVRRRRARA